MNTPKLISKTATVFDREGYMQERGVEVYDHGDTISIGATEHLKDDLTVTDDEIESIHGWTVEL